MDFLAMMTVAEVLLGVCAVLMLVLLAILLRDSRRARADHARIQDMLRNVQQTPADTETIQRWFERNAERPPRMRVVP